jgi:hypothetical protein
MTMNNKHTSNLLKTAQQQFSSSGKEVNLWHLRIKKETDFLGFWLTPKQLNSGIKGLKQSYVLNAQRAYQKYIQLDRSSYLLPRDASTMLTSSHSAL